MAHLCIYKFHNHTLLHMPTHLFVFPKMIDKKNTKCKPCAILNQPCHPPKRTKAKKKRQKAHPEYIKLIQFPQLSEMETLNTKSSSIWEGVYLEPVEKFLLLWGRVVNCEQYFSQLTNFEAVRHHWLIGWGHFCGFCHYNCVCIFRIGHEFSTITHLPSNNSQLPNNETFLQCTNSYFKNRTNLSFIAKHS